MFEREAGLRNKRNDHRKMVLENERGEMMAQVLSVNISATKGVVKDPQSSILLEVDQGIPEDAHAGKWHRQISLLGIESFRKMQAQSGIEDLPYGSFAENITTEGICLYELPVGTKLRIGETLHEVTQIGKECHTGCAIARTVGTCVMPKEGIFTRVLKGGTIQAGDVIQVIE